MGMNSDDSFDADEILREPFGDDIEEVKDEEEIEELNLGDPNRMADLDVPEEDEENYGL